MSIRLIVCFVCLILFYTLLINLFNQCLMISSYLVAAIVRSFFGLLGWNPLLFSMCFLHGFSLSVSFSIALFAVFCFDLFFVCVFFFICL